jgi:hypothetical protein
MARPEVTGKAALGPTESQYPPLTVTVREARRLSGFGTTSIYAFIKSGRLKVRRVPGVDRTLILYSSLKELLTPDPSENTTVPPPRRPRGRPRKPARQASVSRRSPQDRRRR